MSALNPALEIDWNEFAHSSLSDALYASLHRAIVNGKILPGTLLREVEVSRHTNVSRTPVREAFRKLESERLVLRMPGRKFVVASPNRGEIEEIFLVRSVLEGLAGRIACSKINPGHIAELKKIVRNMEKGRRERQIDLVIKSNLEFHRLIVDVCRNNVLAQTLNRLWDTVRMLSISSLGNRGWIPNAVQQHKEIIAALEKNEAVSAERLMRDHVIHAGQTLLETQGVGKKKVAEKKGVGGRA